MPQKQDIKEDRSKKKMPFYEQFLSVYYIVYKK